MWPVWDPTATALGEDDPLQADRKLVMASHLPPPTPDSYFTNLPLQAAFGDAGPNAPEVSEAAQAQAQADRREQAPRLTN